MNIKVFFFFDFIKNFLKAFAKQFNSCPDDLDMHVIYDVSHNIAKIEEHLVDGKQKTLLVHRKVKTLETFINVLNLKLLLIVSNNL